MSRPVAVVVAPWKDRTQEEAEKTDEAVAHLLRLGWCPVFLPWALCSSLDDQRPEDRHIALACSEGFVRATAHSPDCTMFVLPGRVTGGMQLDLDAWTDARFDKGQDIRTITFTDRDAP